MKRPSYSIRRIARDENAYREVVAAVRSEPNGELAAVGRTIAAYESKYRISSAEAVGRVERGELAPTLDVEGWLMAIRVRDELSGR